MKPITLLILSCVLLFCSFGAEAQQQEDLPSCLVEKASQLVGHKYLEGTLDKSPVESLVVLHDRFDCVTFVEYALAMAMAEVRGGDMRKILTSLRYREGTINGYGSRLHYFSEWILQQQQRGVLRDVTCTMACMPLNKKINYITSHSSLYPRLAEKGALEAVRAAEARINAVSWHHIPKTGIRAAENSIAEGDILAITATTAGLDFVHTGIAVRKNSRIHLLHASRDHGQVEISRRPLADYISRNRGQAGIVVLRLRN